MAVDIEDEDEIAFARVVEIAGIRYYGNYIPLIKIKW